MSTRSACAHVDTRAGQWADRLWIVVRDGDEFAARDTISEALAAGLDPETVLLDVIGAVQQKVGTEWAANRISVADEHIATAINDRAIAALSASRPATPLGRVTVACVDKEWHALPARLLAETLRLRGWQVDYLGAQVPTAHLVRHLHRTCPDAVCLSSSLSTRLPTAHTAITACQAAGVPVMAGGLAFGPDGRLAFRLGADAWAPQARAAADQLAAGPLPQPSPARQTSDDLPHLIDQEYTLIAQTARRLVRDTVDGLTARVPAMRAQTDEERERSAEDLAHLVDFLAAAVYVDDIEVFTDYLAWSTEILTAREESAHTLTSALSVLEDQLRDFPRARTMLDGGHAMLRSHCPAPHTPEGLA